MCKNAILEQKFELVFRPNKMEIKFHFQGLFRFFPPSGLFPPQSKLWLLLPVCMYLFTEYVFRESVDSAHNSQISSTFQEADCLLKLVKINKQVFAITLLSRNLNHTAQLSISARGGNNNFVSRAGGEETEKTPLPNKGGQSSGTRDKNC